MSLKIGKLPRRGFIKALGSSALAVSAWSLRLVPELGTARSSLVQAASPSTADHPLSKFKSVKHVEPAGDALASTTQAILSSDDIRNVAASAGFVPSSLRAGKVSLEIDAGGRTLTFGAWTIDDKRVLIYAAVDRRLEWFKSLSMVVTTDTKIGEVKAYTLNGLVPSAVKPPQTRTAGPVSALKELVSSTEAEASFCCGDYYSCCYDQWGNWHEYWQWTGSSPCGINWQCAADLCVPCAAAFWGGPEAGLACVAIVCGYAIIRCTYWCSTCYYCYVT